MLTHCFLLNKLSSLRPFRWLSLGKLPYCGNTGGNSHKAGVAAWIYDLRFFIVILRRLFLSCAFCIFIAKTACDIISTLPLCPRIQAHTAWLPRPSVPRDLLHPKLRRLWIRCRLSRAKVLSCGGLWQAMPRRLTKWWRRRIRKVRHRIRIFFAVLAYWILVYVSNFPKHVLK